MANRALLLTNGVAGPDAATALAHWQSGAETDDLQTAAVQPYASLDSGSTGHDAGRVLLHVMGSEP